MYTFRNTLLYKYLINLLQGLLMHTVAKSWTDDTTPRTEAPAEFIMQCVSMHATNGLFRSLYRTGIIRAGRVR